MTAAVASGSTTGRESAALVTNPVRVVAPIVPGVLPVLRRQYCMMGNALLNAPMGTMLRPLADAELVTIRVPAALDPRAPTAQPASSPGLCVKATACPAVERASTLTTGSAKPVIPLASLVWVQNPLTVSGVRSPGKACRLRSCLARTSPLASVCLSVEPSFTWRTRGCAKLATSPVSGVLGRAHVTAQPAGLPKCCWTASVSRGAQTVTLTRKAGAPNATPPAGSATARRKLTALPVTLMSLLLAGAAGPAARKSSS